MTDEIEKKALEYMGKIETMGVPLKPLSRVTSRPRLLRVAYQYQKEIEAKKRIVVGINQFKTEEEPLHDSFESIRRQNNTRRRKLSRIKKERDQERVRKTLVP